MRDAAPVVPDLDRRGQVGDPHVVAVGKVDARRPPGPIDRVEQWGDRRQRAGATQPEPGQARQAGDREGRKKGAHHETKANAEW